MKTIKLKFHADPGHGWLAVPLNVYLKSGIQATPYSYVNRSRSIVYLEEDCDANAFVEAMKAQGVEIVPVYKHTNRQSRIRSMDRISVLHVTASNS